MNNLITVTKNLFKNLDVTDKTTRDYRKNFDNFLSFASNYNGEKENIFLEYKRDLRKKELSISTKNKYLTAARIGLKELNRTGKIQRDLTQNVKGFRQNSKHKKFGLTEKEVITILDKVKRGPPRTRAMVSLLLYQGLRTIEVTRLSIEDLNLKEKSAFILGKGRDDKERIRLHDHTIKSLTKYIAECSRTSGPLFVANKYKAGQRLSQNGFYKIIKKLLTSLGIEKSPHSFRHFFTTHLVRAYGGNLLAVKRLTRHRSIDMLQVYWDDCLEEDDSNVYEESFNKLVGSIGE